jgi:hypothetical protein
LQPAPREQPKAAQVDGTRQGAGASYGGCDVKSTRKWKWPAGGNAGAAIGCDTKIIWGEGMITDFYGLVNFEVQA